MLEVLFSCSYISCNYEALNNVFTERKYMNIIAALKYRIRAVYVNIVNVHIYRVTETRSFACLSINTFVYKNHNLNARTCKCRTRSS